MSQCHSRDCALSACSSVKFKYVASRVLYLVDRGKLDICGVQVDDRPCSNVKDEVLAVPGLQKIACRNL